MGLEVIGIVATIASGVMTFVSGQQQASALKQQANFTRKQAAVDADEFRRRQRRLLSSARAGRGAAGVDLLQGSSLLVDDDTIAEIEFGAENIRNGGDVQATRLDQQAGQARASSFGGLVTAAGGLGESVLGADLFSGGASADIASNNRFGPGARGNFVP